MRRELAAAVITSVFAIGAILVLFVWRDSILRRKSLQRERNRSDAELEDALGMEIQRRIVENDDEFQREFKLVPQLARRACLSSWRAS